MKPKVSFVVPCYKLGHLLAECVSSILSQTYGDFEVLILDDCSPDDTPQVAQAFDDPRVKYIRNEPNLGHLRNYNKGISLARGKYVWLISADDRLRRDYVLERYVRLMDDHPRVGYVFCAGVGLENGQESGVLDWGSGGKEDAVMNGREFLRRLIFSNAVIAASGLVRKECYDKLTMFPLDLPYAGDWYLWCIFALHYDVAYLAEPMVNYRLHDLSMTNSLTRRKRLTDNLAVRWRMKRHAEEARCSSIAEQCMESLARHYAYCVVSRQFRDSDYSMSLEECEESLVHHADGPREGKRIRGRIYAHIGDGCYRQGENSEALRFYRLGLAQDAWMPKVWIKQILLRMGSFGAVLRLGLAPRR